MCPGLCGFFFVISVHNKKRYFGVHIFLKERSYVEFELWFLFTVTTSASCFRFFLLVVSCNMLSFSPLDNAPNYLVGCVIQKRYSIIIVIIFTSFYPGYFYPRKWWQNQCIDRLRVPISTFMMVHSSYGRITMHYHGFFRYNRVSI